MTKTDDFCLTGVLGVRGGSHKMFVRIANREDTEPAEFVEALRQVTRVKSGKLGWPA